jgi:hypothetical protein
MDDENRSRDRYPDGRPRNAECDPAADETLTRELPDAPERYPPIGESPAASQTSEEPPAARAPSARSSARPPRVQTRSTTRNRET